MSSGYIVGEPLRNRVPVINELWPTLVYNWCEPCNQGFGIKRVDFTMVLVQSLDVIGCSSNHGKITLHCIIQELHIFKR